MGKKRKNEYNLGRYLKQQKLPILLYIFTEVFGNILTLIATIVIADCLTSLTLNDFRGG